MIRMMRARDLKGLDFELDYRFRTKYPISHFDSYVVKFAYNFIFSNLYIKFFF